jgi:hypothetical protein
VILNIAQTVMTPVSSPRSHAHLAQRQVEIVAHDQQFLQRHLVKIDNFPNASAAQVHEGLGLDQQNSLRILGALGRLSLKTILKSAAMRTGRQRVDYCIPDVMARPLILAPGIA